MQSNDFLCALRNKLKGFSQPERNALLEEIGSHLEAGAQDPGLDPDPERRKEKLMAEMGSPAQLDRGFRDVHRPGRLVDFLLILLPSLLFSIISRLDLSHWLGASSSIIQVCLFFSFYTVLMLFVSLLRRSLYLQLYWITPFIMGLIYLAQFLSWKYLQISQHRMAIIVQPGYPYVNFSFAQLPPWAGWILPAVLQLVLVLVVMRMLRSARPDSLSLVYACLLVYMGILSYYRPYLDQSVANFFHIYSYWGVYDPNPLARLGWLVSLGGLWNWIELGLLGIFFVSSKRDVRWLALGSYAIAYGIFDVLTTRLSGYWAYLLLIELLLPLALFFTGWYLEHLRKRRLLSAL